MRSESLQVDNTELNTLLCKDCRKEKKKKRKRVYYLTYGGYYSAAMVRQE